MAKVLIDIPDEIFNNIKDNMMTYVLTDSYHLIAGKAIAEGTPLPKGCGRIVDIDKLIESKCNECGHIRGVSCTVPCYEVRRMLSAPTIIEVDTE